MLMDKEEIIRICTYFNQHNQYSEAFDTSKDLGVVSDVIPVVQENMPSLLGKVEDAWSLEFQALSQIDYLQQVTGKIASVPLRLVAIEYIQHNTAIQFTFDFNLNGCGVTVEGISILSFGVSFSVTGSKDPGTGKKVKKQNTRTREISSDHFIPLKKAS